MKHRNKVSSMSIMLFPLCGIIWNKVNNLGRFTAGAISDHIDSPLSSSKWDWMVSNIYLVMKCKICLNTYGKRNRHILGIRFVDEVCSAATSTKKSKFPIIGSHCNLNIFIGNVRRSMLCISRRQWWHIFFGTLIIQWLGKQKQKVLCLNSNSGSDI